MNKKTIFIIIISVLSSIIAGYILARILEARKAKKEAKELT